MKNYPSRFPNFQLRYSKLGIYKYESKAGSPASYGIRFRGESGVESINQFPKPAIHL